MLKIAMIGAGSIVFNSRLIRDILSVDELRETEFRLMDINPENLKMAENLCNKLIKDKGLEAEIYATTDRREAIRGADYVICMIRIGGMEALAHDVEIPLKYGVNQCVGDTLGPGGIFYMLRTVPVLLDIARDMKETAPNAVLLNYSNPMAMNTWALRRAGGVNVIGLCHGVQGGHKLIASVFNIPHEEIDYICAGINHQTWFIQITHKGRDLLPDLLEAFQNNPEISRKEPVRMDVLKRFGYFSTESNGHLSEYLPWYRKRPGELEKWTYREGIRFQGGKTAGYLKFCRARRNGYKEQYEKWMSGEEEFLKFPERTHEHGSFIIEALNTGKIYRGNFNIENRGIITNLPEGCTVEVPCFVDANGINPVLVGKLPMQCAATCRSSINVQEMAVEAALTGNRELVKLAVLHDPLTAAVCTTDEVWRMCDEMFDALYEWLPQFNGEGRKWKDIPQPNDGFVRRNNIINLSTI